MNCENLDETIDLSLNQLRQLEVGSKDFESACNGIAKLVEASAKQTEAVTKDYEVSVNADIQQKKNDAEIQLARERLDLDARIAEKEAELRAYQAQNETKDAVIRILPAVGTVAICLTEFGLQTYLEQTGHLWSPFRAVTNLANKMRL